MGHLTLNLGLRYEVYPPGTEVAGRQANFDPATGTMFTAATDPHGSGLRRGRRAPRYDLGMTGLASVAPPCVPDIL